MTIDFKGCHYPKDVILYAVFFYVRWVKNLNNIVEQDHRFIKKNTRPTLGFKAFHSAAATLAGIEVAHMIRKKQIHTNCASPFQTFASLVA